MGEFGRADRDFQSPASDLRDHGTRLCRRYHGSKVDEPVAGPPGPGPKCNWPRPSLVYKWDRYTYYGTIGRSFMGQLYNLWYNRRFS